MAKPPRHIPRDTSRRRLSIYIGVAAFIAVDVMLIGIALGTTRAGEETDSGRGRLAGAATVNTSTPSATATPTAPLAASAILPIPPTRLLSSVDENTAWRAATGDCPATAAAPELTTDGGTTWKTTDATGPAEVTSIQMLMATSESTVALVGLDEAGCDPMFAKTFVGGDSFKSYPGQLAGGWYVNPADRATVHSPAGDTTAPCDAVVTLAVRDDRSAASLCADGDIFATEDAVVWSPLSTVRGAVSITDSEAGYLAAAVGRPGCAGVQIIALTPDFESPEATCFDTAALPEDLTGNVAVSAIAETMWLWVGDEIVRSTDGGSNWK